MSQSTRRGARIRGHSDTTLRDRQTGPRPLLHEMVDEKTGGWSRANLARPRVGRQWKRASPPPLARGTGRPWKTSQPGGQRLAHGARVICGLARGHSPGTRGGGHRHALGAPGGGIHTHTWPRRTVPRNYHLQNPPGRRRWRTVGKAFGPSGPLLHPDVEFSPEAMAHRRDVAPLQLLHAVLRVGAGRGGPPHNANIPDTGGLTAHPGGVFRPHSTAIREQVVAGRDVWVNLHQLPHGRPWGNGGGQLPGRKGQGGGRQVEWQPSTGIGEAGGECRHPGRRW